MLYHGNDNGRRTLLLLAMAFLLQQGCGSSNITVPVTVPDPTVPNPRRFGSLEFALTTTKRQFTLGEAVPLNFTVKNVGNQTVTATIGACDNFDTRIQANSGAGALVWQRSQTVFCGAQSVQVSIAPGEIKHYTYNWDQKDTQGNAAEAGGYIIKSWFMGYSPVDPNLPSGQQETKLYALSIQIGLTAP